MEEAAIKSPTSIRKVLTATAVTRALILAVVMVFAAGVTIGWFITDVVKTWR